MAFIYAKDKERLEAIFYREHGVGSDRYREFCEKNIHIINKYSLDAGDKVILLDAETDAQSSQLTEEKRVSLWG